MLSKEPGNKVKCETLCGLLSSSINQASSALSLLSLIVSDVSFQAQNVVLSLVSDITVATRLANQLLQQLNRISDREMKVHDVLKGLSNLIQKQRLKISQLTDKPPSLSIGTITDDTYFNSNCIKCEGLINLKVLNGMLEENLNISNKRIMELEEQFSTMKEKLENKNIENLRLTKGIGRYKNLLREAQIVIESQQDLIDSYKRRDSHSPRSTSKKKSKMIDPFIDYRSSSEIDATLNLDNEKEPSAHSALPRTPIIKKYPTIKSNDVWSRVECGDGGGSNSSPRLNKESIPPNTDENVNNINKDEMQREDVNDDGDGDPKDSERTHRNRQDYDGIHYSAVDDLYSKSSPIRKIEMDRTITPTTTPSQVDSWKSHSYKIIEDFSTIQSATEPNFGITSTTIATSSQPAIKHTSSSYRYTNPELDSYMHPKSYHSFADTYTDEQWNDGDNDEADIISQYAKNVKLKGNPLSPNDNNDNNSGEILSNNGNKAYDDYDERGGNEGSSDMQHAQLAPSESHHISSSSSSSNDIDSNYTNIANLNVIGSRKEVHCADHDSHNHSQTPLLATSGSSIGDDRLAAKSSWGSVDCLDDSFSLIQKYYQPSGIA